MSDSDKPLYRVWLHSPSVFGTETETILAYKIAQEIQGIPSRVLKALRALPGVDPELRRRVEEFVENDDSLAFVEGGALRSIALAGLRTIDLDLGSHTIQCDESGQGERPLILLHGLTGHRKDFERVLPALASCGRNLAPDLRGHGNSSHSGSSDGYDFENLVEDLRRFLDLLEIDRCDLLGHSFGGMLALRFALAHPDRVASLILMSTSCEAPDILTREVFLKAGGFAESKGMEKLQARLEELGRADESPEPSDATQDQRDWRDRYWAHHKLRVSAMDPYAYGSLGLAMMDQSSLDDRLAEIKCPSTVIIGTRDEEFQRGAGILMARLDAVVSHRLEGIGHHPQQESRDAFLTIVREHLERAR